MQITWCTTMVFMLTSRHCIRRTLNNVHCTMYIFAYACYIMFIVVHYSFYPWLFVISDLLAIAIASKSLVTNKHACNKVLT